MVQLIVVSDPRESPSNQGKQEEEEEKWISFDEFYDQKLNLQRQCRKVAWNDFPELKLRHGGTARRIHSGLMRWIPCIAATSHNTHQGG